MGVIELLTGSTGSSSRVRLHGFVESVVTQPVTGGLVRVDAEDGKIVLDIRSADKPRLTGNKPPLLTAE